jgi:hypothetical protein
MFACTLHSTRSSQESGISALLVIESQQCPFKLNDCVLGIPCKRENLMHGAEETLSGRSKPTQCLTAVSKTRENNPRGSEALEQAQLQHASSASFSCVMLLFGCIKLQSAVYLRCRRGDGIADVKDGSKTAAEPKLIV